MPKDAKKNTGMEDDDEEMDEDDDDDDDDEDGEPEPVAVKPAPGADKGGGGGKITMESRFAMMKELKAAGGAAKAGPAYPKAQWHMY